jgi:anti-sigma factor RsiW
MECQTVRSLLVPYLDGELAPAQIDWIDAHCAICEDCRTAAALLSRQSEVLAALPPPPMPSQVASALWNQLDADLAPALSQMEAHASPVLNAPQMAFRDKVRLSRRAIAGYAALLCLAVAFGLWRHDAAATAEANVQTLRVKLERAERLHASPRPLPARTSGFQTAAYTRGRGHL